MKRKCLIIGNQTVLNLETDDVISLLGGQINLSRRHKKTQRVTIQHLRAARKRIKELEDMIQLARAQAPEILGEMAEDIEQASMSLRDPQKPMLTSAAQEALTQIKKQPYVYLIETKNLAGWVEENSTPYQEPTNE